METSIKIVLKEFEVPEFVLEVPPHKGRPAHPAAQNPAHVARVFALSEIPPSDLMRMCDTFRKGVFSQAGVRMPPQDPWGEAAPLYDITPILIEILRISEGANYSDLERRLQYLIRGRDSSPGVVMSVLTGESEIK